VHRERRSSQSEDMFPVCYLRRGIGMGMTGGYQVFDPSRQARGSLAHALEEPVTFGRVQNTGTFLVISPASVEIMFPPPDSAHA
jgi:hypothetical protein